MAEEVADPVDSMSQRLSWRFAGLVLMLEKLLVLLGYEALLLAQLFALCALLKLLMLLKLPIRGS